MNYLTLEIKRAFRSARFLVFALIFPVVMFLLQAGVFINPDDAGSSDMVAVFMVNMMAFGSLGATVSLGARLAAERANGWQRQLRLTPLTGLGYLAGKTASGMLVVLPALILVPVVAVLAQGVQLDASSWVRVIVGIWLGAIPFVLLGVLLGQLGTPESMQPINLVVMMSMGFLGGLWIPIDIMPGWMQNFAPVLPSYWLTQIGRGAVTDDLSVGLGSAAAVLAVWTAVLGAGVIWRYVKDSSRS